MIEAPSVKNPVARFAKLRAMSLRELLARATYETYTAYKRDQYRRGRLAPPDRLQRALDPAIARQSNWQEESSHAVFFQRRLDRTNAGTVRG